MSDTALVLIKPDSYERGLDAVIFQRLRDNGLEIVVKKVILLNEEMIRAYQPILNEPSEFGESWKIEVITALTRCPVEVLIVKGENAMRKAYLLKKQMRSEYCHGSDYQSRVIFNLLHTADDPSELENNIRILISEVNHPN